MSISRVKTWGSETLTSADLNAEFNNIITQALSLISPLTGDLAAGGNDITGLDELALNDASAGASAAGRLRRNSTNLTWHDGTASRNVIHAGNTTSITSVGTVATGVWSGTAVSAAKGGTAIDTSASTGVPQVAAGTWSILSGAVPAVIVVKSANETVNGSSTLQDDNHLLYAMAANTSYWVEVYLLLTGASTTADWKFGWTVPVAGTMFWAVGAASNTSLASWSPNSVSNSPSAINSEAGTESIAGISGTIGANIWAIVRNGANAGNLQLQWAQNTLTAEDNIILKDSFMRIVKLQ